MQEVPAAPDTELSQGSTDHLTSPLRLGAQNSREPPPANNTTEVQLLPPSRLRQSTHVHNTTHQALPSFV